MAIASDPQWLVIEELLMDMRRLWFDAEVRPFYSGQMLEEPEGNLVACICGTPAEADALLSHARLRRMFVAVTPFTEPPDIIDRLRQAGFYLIQRQGMYTFSGDSVPPLPVETRRALWDVFRRPEPVRIDVVDLDRLAAWNRTCREAFGHRGLSEAASLQEKQRALRAMGDRARWYLAYVGPRPAGTCILYQGDGAAQLLAVGTSPRFRRRGVASALVSRAIRDWQADGTGFLFLDTRPGGVAERLYRRLGFELAYIRSIYAA